MRNLPHALAQRSLRVHPAPIVVHRARHPHAPACLSHAHCVSAHQVVHHLTLLDGLQNFFWSTSCSIALSSERSATRRLSLTFSSRNCFSSRASDGSIPP